MLCVCVPCACGACRVCACACESVRARACVRGFVRVVCVRAVCVHVLCVRACRVRAWLRARVCACANLRARRRSATRRTCTTEGAISPQMASAAKDAARLTRFSPPPLLPLPPSHLPAGFSPWPSARGAGASGFARASWFSSVLFTLARRSGAGDCSGGLHRALPRMEAMARRRAAPRTWRWGRPVLRNTGP